MYNTKPVEIFEFHRSMLIDEVRMNSFLSAILQTVKAGDVVLDIGSGTGVLACFACQAGAKHVYAIEQGPVIGLAREICARNGFQDRVTFINDWSTNTRLPEPVDLLVTETIGNIGFDEGILHWALDARKRFLRPKARIIPRTLEMFAVPVESKEDYEMVDKWARRYFGLDFSPLHTFAASNLLWVDFLPEMFLSDPASIAFADLARIDRGDLAGEVSFVVQRAGTVHGIGGWFAAELAPGVTLSNAPSSKTPSWTNSFLPLESPLEVQAGDKLDLKIHTSLNAARWQWQIAHQAAGAGGITIFPQQTTRDGELSALAATADLAHVPSRSTAGDIDLFILERINGTLPVAEIARQTETRFSNKFASDDTLLERIYDLMSRYAGA